MKKLLVAVLAVVGVLASCSKETPAVPVDQQGQVDQGALLKTPVNINDSDSDSKGVRYSFNAEIEPFELSTEGFDGSKNQTEEARAIHTYFGSGNRRGNKAEFISYKLSNESDLSVRVVVYDSQGAASFTAKAKVASDGKEISFEFPEENVPKVTGLKSIFERIKNGTSGNPKMALLVNSGKDGAWSDRFDNKGAYLYKYSAGKSIELPKNFVVLKSVENPLEYKNEKIQVKTGHKMKLKMQGYLLAIRFRNYAYPTVIKHTWAETDLKLKNKNGPYQSDMNGVPVPDSDPVIVKRPDLRLSVRVQALSFSYPVEFQFNRNNPDRFTAEPIRKQGSGAIDYSTPGLTPSEGLTPTKKHPDDFVVQFQNTNSHIVRVPVEPNRVTGQVPVADEVKVANQKSALREGEPIALLYCPDPVSHAVIWFLATDTLFYDLSEFSQSLDGGDRRYYSVFDVPNAIQKSIDKMWDQSIGGYVSKADGKVFLPMFHIDPPRGQRPPNKYRLYSKVGLKNSNPTDAEIKARWEAYQERNKEATPVQ